MRLRAGEALSLWQRVAQLGAAVELWCFQSVVSFDKSGQMGALRSRWSGGREHTRSPQLENSPPGSPEPSLPGTDLTPLLLGLLLAGAAPHL